MDNENVKRVSLTGEFPAVSTQEWENKIREDLKGADYYKKLVWETHDRYGILPYYRREDLGGINYLESQPGRFPFLRSTKTEDNSWLIRQDILVQKPGADEKEANQQAKEILERGVTSLGFDLSKLEKTEEADIHSLLEGLPLDRVPVNFTIGDSYLMVLESLYSFIRKNNIDPLDIHGSISLDPLGRLTATGKYRKEKQSDFSELGDCLAFARQNLPRFRIINTSADIFHDSGASVSQVLAFSLSMGNEYLVRLIEMGFKLENILPNIQFQFSIGSSYFMEIAKLRAARFLWSRILEAHSPAAEKLPAMFIQSMTSRWNQTLFDPHVNLLRGTTASMSAILGGTDSLRVTEFDSPFSESNPFSSRIARNTQVILKEESYLDKVIDPGAGSYYIENLTDTLISGTWKLFLETEEKGGYEESLIKGFVQQEVRHTAGIRMENLATRKEMLLGTNQFPILDEIFADTGTVDLPSADKSSGEENTIDPLETFRAARDFEELRLKTENYSGTQPVVFIIPLGNLAMRRARAMFTMNFFACAGFRVIDNIGKFKTLSDGMDAARESGADIVVLCSSDDEYPDMAADLVSLSESGSATGTGRELIPVIAGYPKEHMEKLKKDGIEHFIHVRSNVLEELKNYQSLLGI